MLRLVVIAALLAALPAMAHDGTEPADFTATALATSQAAIGRVVRDVVLQDEAGAFRLSALLGQPVILSPVYTSCAHTCPLITRALADAVGAARRALGPGKFTVLTVGFDVPTDTVARMAAYGRDQGVRDANWRFVTGVAPEIAALLADIGLTVRPAAGGFDHVAQVTLLDGDGRVVRQVYGDDFAAPILVDPLLDLVLKGSATTSFLDGVIDRVVLFCTVYDPATGAYRFDYSLFIELAIGGLSIAAVGAFLWRESRRSLAARR